MRRRTGTVRMRMYLAMILGLVVFHPLQAGLTDLFPRMGTEEITGILNQASAGDTLLFHPGQYSGPFRLAGLHGSPELPVVIRGTSSEEVVIDNRSEPGMLLENQAFVLSDCSWIRIEHFTIRNCWMDLVLADPASWISLRHCRLEGGKRALFAKGRDSHHFLVEHCSWEQDKRVWTHEDGYSWEELHHGIYRHYNGSIFQGFGISGVFVLRDNVIRNTYNAFRLSLINEGDMDLLACTNGEIYRNRVYNTSDNVLEPEVHAGNLHFYHNQMVNGHAFISVTEVSGGDIYIYGNTAVSLPASEDGWTVFKISSGRRALTRPMYIFNNSWQVDFDMVGYPIDEWRNDHIRHFNNACVSEVSDSFGIYQLGEDNCFDFDASNVPFPSLLTAAGNEKNGILADPMFEDPYGGDFRLKPGSPCVDRGREDPERILDFQGPAPDIGAYDNGHLVEGIPFRYRDPEIPVPYRELPRITRTRQTGDELHLWFSLPIDAFSLRSVRMELETTEGSCPLEFRELSDDSYHLVLSSGPSGRSGSGRENPAGDLPANFTENPAGVRPVLLLSDWPVGLDGSRLTSWASEIPVKRTTAGGDVRLAEQALAVARKVADKVIRESSFEYRMVPLGYNGGMVQVPFEPCREGQVCFARCTLESDRDAEGLLGLSFAGHVRVFLNGGEVFEGRSDRTRIREYTYDRYLFQEQVPVHFREGANEVLVKWTRQGLPGEFLMMPQNGTDAKLPYVNAVPVPGDKLAVYWQTSGPWTADRGDAMKRRLPPEKGYEPSYEWGGRTCTWGKGTVPLLRELVIPEGASYVRDPYAEWHYANGGTLMSILRLYETSGDPAYLEFGRQWGQNLLENLDYFREQYRELHAMRGSFHRVFRKTMLDDTGGPAIPLPMMEILDPQCGGCYGYLMDAMYRYVLYGQERLSDGTYCRPEPEPATVWADDLFMCTPFLLDMRAVIHNDALLDSVALQVIRFNRYLEDPETGLYFHGWYDQRKEHTPVRWGRANGWVAWATSEALLSLPEDHPSYPEVLGIFRSHMEALASFQDPSGMWHQVLDHPETWEESSCTAMFALAMARGVRRGWLDASYREKALKAWTALQAKIGEDGTVSDICRGTGIGVDVDFYAGRKRFDHDPRGLGAVIGAGIEISLMER